MYEITGEKCRRSQCYSHIGLSDCLAKGVQLGPGGDSTARYYPPGLWSRRFSGCGPDQEYVCGAYYEQGDDGTCGQMISEGGMGGGDVNSAEACATWTEPFGMEDQPPLWEL